MFHLFGGTMILLRNDTLSMEISTHGAEPQSLKNTELHLEYIWNGNKEYWFRHAPLLFPMTGPTKDNTIAVENKIYPMPNNGFARDSEFSVLENDDNHAVFVLVDSAETRAMYPFAFTLTVTYTLLSNGYTAKAEIQAKDDLYFTFGWHPAFSLDINGMGTPLEQYYVTFDAQEQVDRKYPVNGVFHTEKNFLAHTNELALSRTETAKGPIILEKLKSGSVTLKCKSGTHGVTVTRGDMGTFVIWTCAPKQAQYLCLEPMRSFGDTTRPLELKEMKEAEFLAKGKSKVFENSFYVF
jgi:galactose mutarotase-like enzyme